MTRPKLALAIAAITVAGALVLRATRQDSPIAVQEKTTQYKSAGAREEPPVTIEHRFVTVQALPKTEPAPQQARGPESTVATASSTAPGGRTVGENSAGRRGILVRAGRAILGDGKHRPQPFPRVDDH